MVVVFVLLLKIMIMECRDVATSAVTRDFQCFLSLASLRLVSG